ncbi:MAG: flagellin-like protein [Candidatus Woesearchaeota archaeon]|jgi:flagellin-like protein
MAMVNKRGVSPLIATVLLIAFAVSLGAVIMNLGADLAHNACSTASIEVKEVGGKARICVDDASKELKITVENTGEALNGLKISIIGQSVVNEDIVVDLEPTDIHVETISIGDIGFVDAVTVTPVIVEEEDITYCSDHSIEYIDIPKC